MAVTILSAGMFAQSSPPSCPADRPVDDIIAEVNKQQSKKDRRNPNPLPDFICIWGWCRDRPRTSPTDTDPAPGVSAPSGGDESSSSSSAGKPSVSDCDEAMESALKAAQNVDVGDYYFAKENYRGALFRYEDASKEKPKDAAIRVRLGRAFEKLRELEKATEQYETAKKLGGPKKWSDEAEAALQRLQNKPRR